MYQILTLNKISETGLSHFDPARFTCASDTLNPDAIIVRSASLHEMELPENLLAVARAGAGVNNVPIDRCTAAGVCVFNTPGANANAVKELVICALFLASRKIVEGAKWAEGLKGSGAEVSKKVEKGKSAFAGPEIMGKTLGVYGLGAIGCKVANAARALGMDVIGYDPYLSPAAKAALDPAVKIADSLDEVLAAADYITLHAPLTDSTRGVICAGNFAKMKDGVRVLNFSRAELVDETDLLAALESGKCAAYATDFPTDAELATPGVIAIPHLGASTPEAEENCAVMAVNQLADYLTAGNVKNSVNLPALSLEKSAKVRVTAITEGDIAESLQAALADAGVTVTNCASALKKNVGYCIFDTNDEIADEQLERLKSVPGVTALRII